MSAHQQLLTDAERLCILRSLDPDQAHAIMLVVEYTLELPANSLADSCRELLATPYDERLHPHIQEMLDHMTEREGESND